MNEKQKKLALPISARQVTEVKVVDTLLREYAKRWMDAKAEHERLKGLARDPSALPYARRLVDQAHEAMAVACSNFQSFFTEINVETLANYVNYNDIIQREYPE